MASQTLDKESKTLGKRQYHIQLSPGDIGEYVLLPGDPARSDRVASYLDDAKLVGNNREHRSFTGYYKGVKVSVTSTGMGCPSASIAAEELLNIGAECLFRLQDTDLSKKRMHGLKFFLTSVLLILRLKR